MCKHKVLKSAWILAVVIALGATSVSAQPLKAVGPGPEAKEALAQPTWGEPAPGIRGPRAALAGRLQAARVGRGGPWCCRQGARIGQYGTGFGRGHGRAFWRRGRGLGMRGRGLKPGAGRGRRMHGMRRAFGRRHGAGFGAAQGGPGVGPGVRRGSLLRRLIASGQIELNVRPTQDGAALVLRSDNETIAKRLRKILQRLDRSVEKRERGDMRDRPKKSRPEDGRRPERRKDSEHRQERRLREKREESLEGARRNREKRSEDRRRDGEEYGHEAKRD